MGVLIAHAFAHGLHTPRPLGALLIALSLIGFAANASGAGDRIVGWGLPAALLVLGVMGFESWPGLKSKWLVLGGNASYAMYLFQLPAMALVRDCANRFGLPVDGWSWIPRELALLGSVILVAVAVHLWVEKPLTRWLRRMADRHLRSPFADSAALGK